METIATFNNLFFCNLLPVHRIRAPFSVSCVLHQFFYVLISDGPTQILDNSSIDDTWKLTGIWVQNRYSGKT